MTNLTGPYKILDLAYVRGKAHANDPRAVFAKACFECTTYEAYLAMVGNNTVQHPQSQLQVQEGTARWQG